MLLMNKSIRQKTSLEGPLGKMSSPRQATMIEKERENVNPV